MSDLELQCPTCRNSVPAEANFCGGCNAPLAGLRRVCSSAECRHFNQVNSKFCVRCGQELGAQGVSQVLVRWDLGDDEVARRIVEKDLGAAIRGEVLVGRHTHALFYKDGRLVDVLAPGVEDISSSPLQALVQSNEQTHSLEVVYTTVGDLEVPLVRLPAFSADPLRVDTTCTLVVRVADPKLLVENLFRDPKAGALTVHDLAEHLAPETHQAVRDVLAPIHFEARKDDLPALRDEMAAALSEKIRPSLTRYGLEMIRFRLVEIRQSDLQRWTGQEVRLKVVLFDQEQALDHRRQLFEATESKERQALYEQQARLRQSLERLDLLEQEQELVRNKRRSALDAAETLEKLELEHQARRQKVRLDQISDVEKEKLLQKAALTDLRREITDHQQDDQYGRQRALQKLQAEHQLEMQRFKNEFAELTGSARRSERRAETDNQADLERIRVQPRREQSEWELNQRIKAEEKKLELDEVRKDREVERQKGMISAKAEALARMKKDKAEAKAIEFKAAEGLSPEKILAVLANEGVPQIDRIFASVFNQEQERKMRDLIQQFRLEQAQEHRQLKQSDRDLVQQLVGALQEIKKPDPPPSTRERGI